MCVNMRVRYQQDRDRNGGKEEVGMAKELRALVNNS